jgi:hypothetical protein
MILPITVGFVIGRFVSRKPLVIGILGLVAGVVLGLVAGFEILPLMYPFMIVQIPFVGIPEIRRVGISLVIPYVVLLEESIHYLSYSLMFMSFLTVVSVVGTIIGVFVGKQYNPGVVDSPWRETSQEL